MYRNPTKLKNCAISPDVFLPSKAGLRCLSPDPSSNCVSSRARHTMCFGICLRARIKRLMKSANLPQSCNFIVFLPLLVSSSLHNLCTSVSESMTIVLYFCHCLGFSLISLSISPSILALTMCMRSAFGFECIILACPFGSVSSISGAGADAARKDFPAPESPYMRALMVVCFLDFPALTILNCIIGPIFWLKIASQYKYCVDTHQSY